MLFPAVPASSITGEDLPAAKRLAPAIGFAERPLGPARWNHVSPQDFYRAVLYGTPYPVRGLIGLSGFLSLGATLLGDVPRSKGIAESRIQWFDSLSNFALDHSCHCKFTSAPSNVRCYSIVLQKSFCTDDQNFCGLQARLSCKDVRDLIASR